METKPRPRIPYTLLVLSLLTITLWGAQQAADFLIPLSFAALLAFLMTPLVQLFRRAQVPEWVSIVFSVIAILAPIFTLGYFLSREVDHFIRESPRIMDALQVHWDSIAHSTFGRRLRLSNVMHGSTLRQRAAEETSQGVKIILEGLHGLLSMGSEVLLVILLGVVMVISRHSLRRGLDLAFEAWQMARSHVVLDEAIMLIERFLIARLALVLLVAVADLIILRLFKVNFFVILAVMLGVMTLIPAVGFIIALVPTLIASLISGNSLLKTTTLFGALCVVSVLESHILTPKWVGKRINLNLLATFVGLFAGERLWGIPGMFLSLPFLAILRIIFAASPNLKPLGDLLSDREDNVLAHKLSGPPRKRAA